jgi:hypothetical protein
LEWNSLAPSQAGKIVDEEWEHENATADYDTPDTPL